MRLVALKQLFAQCWPLLCKQVGWEPLLHAVGGRHNSQPGWPGLTGFDLVAVASCAGLVLGVGFNEIVMRAGLGFVWVLLRLGNHIPSTKENPKFTMFVNM